MGRVGAAERNAQSSIDLHPDLATSFRSCRVHRHLARNFWSGRGEIFRTAGGL